MVLTLIICLIKNFKLFKNFGQLKKSLSLLQIFNKTYFIINFKKIMNTITIMTIIYLINKNS
jgi:hypothetical protein